MTLYIHASDNIQINPNSVRGTLDDYVIGRKSALCHRNDKEFTRNLITKISAYGYKESGRIRYEVCRNRRLETFHV